VRNEALDTSRTRERHAVAGTALATIGSRCVSIHAATKIGTRTRTLTAAIQLGGRMMKLARLAATSLVDGVLHEGLSARVLARLVTTCEDSSMKQALRELAADEGRHAAHAWDVVEWCVIAGGPSVGAALIGAMAGLSDDLADDLPAPARDGSWERFGIPGAALEAEEYSAARAHLWARVQALGPRVRRSGHGHL
jgi:hypothetical protein